MRTGYTVSILVVALAGIASAVSADAKVEARADKIVRSSGVDAGLVVHLNCTDGKLTAALANRGKFVVHGLAATREKAEKARRHIASLGLHGRASIAHGSFSRLPYVNDLVNLIVVDNFDDAKKHGLTREEILRVLCPNGVAVLGEQEKIVKPRPEGMDAWTHWHHGPDGNELSSDSLVGPSARLQWVDGPFWPRDNGSVRAALFAGGRGFCLMNEGVPRRPRWVLIARDAYNGLVLWKRDVAGANPRLVVAVDNRVFTVLKKGGPPVALDAATGEIVRTYDVGPSPSIILYIDGHLVLGGEKETCSVNARTGALRWRRPAPVNTVFRYKDRRGQPSDSNDKLSLMVAGSGRLFVFLEDAPKPPYSVVSYDLTTGEEKWRRKQTGELLGHYKGVLTFAARTREATWKQPGEGMLYVVSAKDGHDLWSRPRQLRLQQSAILATGGLLWVSDDRRPASSPLVGLDPATGEEKKHVKAHLRTQCSSIKATERYFIGAMTGFADATTGKRFSTPFYKAACTIGQFPANGLIYNFPHICACYPYLRGFQAFAPPRVTLPDKVDVKAADRLEKGPAYGFSARAGVEPPGWRTYRHDPRRSGSTTEAMNPDLKLLWRRTITTQERTQYGKSVTPPVAAGGMVFVAATDAHHVSALDAGTGKLLWRYLLDGRVETPPTIFKGLCLFGANNGWVYCLRASDGELVWRFRAAAKEQRIMSRGRLESSWPVPGVLVENDRAHFAAGRDAKSADGISLLAVDPFSGKPLWEKRLHEIRWGRFYVNDVLVSNGESISMGGWIFDPKTGERREDLKGGEFFRSGTTRSIGLMPFGFLYDRKDGAERCVRYKYTHWSYRGAKGLVLAFTDEMIFGLAGRKSKQWDLLARRSGDAAKDAPVWSTKVPAGTLAMLSAGEHLFVAGPGEKGGLLCAYSVKDGKKLNERLFGDIPIFDGMAAADGRLYVSTQNGQVFCFGAK